MSNFNENTRVQVPAALHLCKLGYTYLDNIEKYDDKTNILVDIFYRSMKRLNPGIEDLECKQLLDGIVVMLQNDDLGKEFYSMLSSNSGIKLIDYANPENNEWHVTTEFTCKNTDTTDEFRPDITCFVNGMPLAFIEVKIPNNPEGILIERERINSRMRNRSFRRFFNITQLMLFSNNQEYDNRNRGPIQGAFYCCTVKEEAFFNVFREADISFVEKYPYCELSENIETKILKHRNCLSIKKLPAYNTNKKIDTPTNRVLTSMLCRERFLFLLKYGFVYVNKTEELDDGTKIVKLVKHVMRYQQMFASLAIKKALSKNKKGGIIWHTQGSGKTELAYYSVRILKDFYAERNTVTKFYFIVDRIALMVQAQDEFVARGLMVRTASNREKLMEDFKSNEIVENNDGKDEIMVVNIQRFKEDSRKINLDMGYNLNLQRIFFIDEAHRGYDPKGSFLANLFDADKNSIKIALTGTPLLREERESWRVFGDYIDTYYYDKSIADGYTLKLMREPIETIYKTRIENIIDVLIKDIKVKKKDIDMNEIIEHENYLNALIDYIIADFRRFRKEKTDDTVGAMIVCRTNSQARALYRLWDERYKRAKGIEESWDEQIMIAAEPMAAYNLKKPLRATLILHDEGDRLERKAYIDEFKKKLTIDVLIVNQMLLTGFDAPRLKKLYLGRSLDGHDLLQALTRVNRPYKGLDYGYVVDFVDIKENFDATNDRYLRELNRTIDDSSSTTPQTLPSNIIIVDKDEIIAKMKEIKSLLFHFTTDNPEEFRKEIDEIENKDTLYELRNALNDTKAITNQIRAFGDDEMKKMIESIAVSGVSTLITEVTHRIERINLFENTDHKADVAGIINIAISELEFEFKKGMTEEMRIIVNDIRERCERVQAEFEANFDQTEDKYVLLSEEFRKYFREKGFIPQDTKDAKESINYMDNVMKQIKEINRRNNNLKNKYKGDERFVRIHKRILEKNEKREKPIISAQEYEIADGLSQMKMQIDNKIYNNINILDNEEAFRNDVLAMIGNTLIQLKIQSTVEDRKYINNLITTEYIQQRNSY